MTHGSNGTEAPFVGTNGRAAIVRRATYRRPMRIFDAIATRDALPFERLVPALRAMFAAGCAMPPRHVHDIAAPDGARMTSLIMPAWLEGRYYGIKVINIAPANSARSLPGLHASYLLHDAVTGVPLALIDGNELTARRTAAASALAASCLARADARHLLVERSLSINTAAAGGNATLMTMG